MGKMLLPVALSLLLWLAVSLLFGWEAVLILIAGITILLAVSIVSSLFWKDIRRKIRNIRLHGHS